MNDGRCVVNPRTPVDIGPLDDYLQCLTDFMGPIDSHYHHQDDDHNDKRVILVGHSFGGIAMQKILAAVSVSAFMPHFSSPPIYLLQEVGNYSSILQNSCPVLLLFSLSFLVSR